MDKTWSNLISKASAAEALSACDATEKSLVEWLADALIASGRPRNEVIRDSRLNQTFAYQILAGTRRASRDKLIQLAFGLRLGLEATSELLVCGGVNPLSPNCRRDVAMAWCLEHRLSVAECDDILWAAGEQTLLPAGSRGI